MALTVLPRISGSPTTRLVEILIRRKLIKPEFSQLLKGKSLSEIANYAVNKKLATDDQISQAFAEFYNLPFISLANRIIPLKHAQLLPEDVAKAFSIAIYQLDGLNLHLAVGDPSKLQRNAPSLLVRLRRQKGLKIHLAIVPRIDVRAAIRKIYHSELQEKPELKLVDTPIVLNQTAKPTDIKASTATSTPDHQASQKTLTKSVEQEGKFVDLRSKIIAQDVLSKIPYEVAKKYKMVVFDLELQKSQFEPPLIKVALVNPDDLRAKEILSYIESRNKILVERYSTDQASFDAVLKQYQQSGQAGSEVKEEHDLKTANQQPNQPTGSTTMVKEKPAPYKMVDQLPSPTSTTGLNLKAGDIINKPSEETNDELQRLAKEQETNLENQDLDKLLKGPVRSVEDLAKVFKGGVIPEIVAATLFLAIHMKASDVHIEAEQDSVRVRFRVDGILHDVIHVPYFLHAPLISRIKILARMKIDEQRIPQDGRFDVVIDKRQVDLRVSTLPTVHGEKIVMRLLDKSEGVLTLEQLGITGTNFDRLVANIEKPFGIILSTGPTGSGKSTTLYAILSRISQPGVNIITLEDPVEYELPGLNQSQVKPQIGFTFAEGLRSVLRQDPNIIMVGEVRDLETAAMATHAALTGHLVLSTLHTNDASGALPRLIDMGVEPYLITSSMNAVIGQRLVRKVCEHCREPMTIPPAVLAHIKRELEAMPTGQMKNMNPNQLVFYHGRGCPECTDGYSGRIGIFEVLTMTDAIEDLAVRKAPALKLKETAIAEGMITMLQDGLIKALKGITTVDEVLRVTTTQIKEVPGGK